jgi:hypothetical protein
MSPTSYRCSTPRRAMVAAGCPRSSVPKVGGVRGGLASRGVAPTVLSGAALGHDRVRDGTGWDQRALGHGHPAPPESLRGSGTPDNHTHVRHLPQQRIPARPSARPARLIRSDCFARSLRPAVVGSCAPAGGIATPLPGASRPSTRRCDGARRNSYVWGIRPRPLGRLGSGRLPAVHPPPIDPVICRGSFSISGRGGSSWGGIPA